MRTLVLGLGNCLLCDEGVGVHAVRALQQERLGDDVELIEVGTAILDALPALAGAERLIIVDAMRGGRPPGSIYRSSLGDCDSPCCVASMHGFDMRRALALAGRAEPALRAYVYGVEPARIEWSLELSPAVAAVMPELLAALRADLSGRPFTAPRTAR